MNRPIYVHDRIPSYVRDPLRIAADERKGRRLRDEYVAGLLQSAWRWLFYRTPTKRPQPETAAHPARA